MIDKKNPKKKHVKEYVHKIIQNNALEAIISKSVLWLFFLARTRDKKKVFFLLVVFVANEFGVHLFFKVATLVQLLRWLAPSFPFRAADDAVACRDQTTKNRQRLVVSSRKT